MDKQKIYDAFIDHGAEQKHFRKALEESDLSDDGMAYRRWQRAQEHYDSERPLRVV